MQLLVLQHAWRRSGLSQPGRYTYRAGRGQADALPVQYRTGEALLLLGVRHLYLSLPALRPEPIRCERGVYCWSESI